jgi:hypothetical protein
MLLDVLFHIHFRALKFTGDGNVVFKTSFGAPLMDCPNRRALKPLPAVQVNTMYTERLKITFRSSDIQSMKLVMPMNYHHFFDDLPHS